MMLPIFPEGVVDLSPDLAVQKEDGQIVYFNGMMPVFMHDEDDIPSFQMITSQFCCSGIVKQADIVRAFGVTKTSVMRAVKRYRDLGPGGFYAPKKTRGANVLTPAVIEETQKLLDEGRSVPEVAAELGLKRDTLAKAVLDGRLHRAKKKDITREQLSTKSERSVEDSTAELGMGATDTAGRIAASMGLGGPVEIAFQPSFDTVNAGVLFSLPALLAVGLLQHTEEKFKLPNGYYRMTSIFLLLSFMALARFKSVESLRYSAPGEWGKMLGLDRVPEVRTLRKKIADLAQGNKPAEWSAKLCSQWMKAAPEDAGALYVDGHVRVYHGKLAHLPRHYVARQKLCLRSSLDYWINSMDGQPFFSVPKDISPGLIDVLELEIVPRLIQDVPQQPSIEELEADPLLHRFTVIFDREGYSPDFFLRLKNKQIACLTYHKFPDEDWSSEEFHPYQVRLASGQVVEMKLAERGVLLTNGLWVREIRKQTDTGHQTSIISTDYKTAEVRLAPRMFARWSQENFFKYMRENFSLDRLVEYCSEEIPAPETVQVIDPKYRILDQEVRKKQGQLNRKLAAVGALTMPSLSASSKEVEAFQEKKSVLDEAVAELQRSVGKLKEDRKAVPRHTTLDKLPEGERFTRCRPQAKRLLDTIKMVAYRAETAMTTIIREKMSRHDDARSLLRSIYTTEADLIPNLKEKTLIVRLHHLSNRSSDEVIQHLCTELNATETIFPDTDLRLVYELVS
jgi:hypothetical protein